MLNKIRNFGYTMKNPMPRKIFFLRNFAPKRYTEFCELMYTLNTQVHLDIITEAEMDSALLSFWFRLLTNTYQTHNDSHLPVQCSRHHL